jgi:hypothetical protein
MTKPLTKPGICQGPNCENSLDGKRSDALYCSSDCKLAAYHARHGTTTKQSRQVIVCQREGCENLIPEHTKITACYCSNACRQKVWNDTHKDRERKKREVVSNKRKEAKRKRDEAKEIEKYIQELMGE